MPVRLPRALLSRILEHVTASPELEVCGLLGGRAGAAVSCHPVANVADHPERRFRMDPRGQIDAFRVLRAAGESLYAIYHSHPQSPAEPSATDRAEAAYPEAATLIVSLLEPGVPQVRAWRLVAGEFREVALRVE